MLLQTTFTNAKDKYPWIMQHQDKSITELEIRHAVLNRLVGLAGREKVRQTLTRAGICYLTIRYAASLFLLYERSQLFPFGIN